jgi:bifunctional DNase/RNase
LTPDAACVDLEMIAYRMGHQNDPICMYVHEVGGSRRLCVLTDGWAWWAIMAQIKQEPASRPRTHAAWAATITELGGELQDVFLDRCEGEDWWIAKLRIVKDARLVLLDVRASDACILALIHGVPIFVAEEALARYADTGEGTGSN